MRCGGFSNAVPVSAGLCGVEFFVSSGVIKQFFAVIWGFIAEIRRFLMKTLFTAARNFLFTK